MSKFTDEIVAPYKASGKKVLYLTIKQKYLDMILSGRKTQEFREVRPSNWKRYLQTMVDPDDGKLIEVEDENGNALTLHYDAIHFAVGYEKVRDEALVEVESSYTEIFVNDDGEPITYEYDEQLWVAEQVVYNLGRIVAQDIKPKTRKH